MSPSGLSEGKFRLISPNTFLRGDDRANGRFRGYLSRKRRRSAPLRGISKAIKPRDNYDVMNPAARINRLIFASLHVPHLRNICLVCGGKWHSALRRVVCVNRDINVTAKFMAGYRIDLSRP